MTSDEIEIQGSSWLFLGKPDHPDAPKLIAPGQTVYMGSGPTIAKEYVPRNAAEKTVDHFYHIARPAIVTRLDQVVFVSDALSACMKRLLEEKITESIATVTFTFYPDSLPPKLWRKLLAYTDVDKEGRPTKQQTVYAISPSIINDKTWNRFQQTINCAEGALVSPQQFYSVMRDDGQSMMINNIPFRREGLAESFGGFLDVNNACAFFLDRAMFEAMHEILMLERDAQRHPIIRKVPLKQLRN
jgi:hypothetical protein